MLRGRRQFAGQLLPLLLTQFVIVIQLIVVVVLVLMNIRGREALILALLLDFQLLQSAVSHSTANLGLLFYG